MVMVAVRGGCVCGCLGGWWEGGFDVIFHITEEGGLELFFLFGGGVLSKFLLDNSSFSAPSPS